ncbi:MAG: hypothetical protein DRJ31_06725 [Candidatus Methanomethylicota archaeon]|uniref:4Fe-4S ferredoxin-type domain-containing protein n=1 Tax=Thermoproteota archaeon TaxID=2056631 RepID=A0A497F3Z1_9CREN|nr:MAG: hypothetical protein DRJ31_06725 [Candidatus Verstraetearchaeota archaeon]RLE53668.1 MAG: hypothetical protein DRJ33_00425 [Candidatus Verstraetearchaeota archaeon]
MLKPSEIKQGVLKPYTVVFKHVFRRPHTLMYPYERLKFSPRYRGFITVDLEKCNGCGMCARACPNKCIELVEVPGMKHKYPKIDYGYCCFCGLCTDSCFRGALKRTEIVELSAYRREDLVVRPEDAQPRPVESVLPMLKRFITVEIVGDNVRYKEVR